MEDSLMILIMAGVFVFGFFTWICWAARWTGADGAGSAALPGKDAAASGAWKGFFTESLNAAGCL